MPRGTSAAQKQLPINLPPINQVARGSLSLPVQGTLPIRTSAAANSVNVTNVATCSSAIPGTVKVINPKTTPSDTLVSGPEVFLIACGRAAFLIQFHLMNLIILQMNIIITLFCTTWTILRMRSRNNEIEIQLMR